MAGQLIGETPRLFFRKKFVSLRIDETAKFPLAPNNILRHFSFTFRRADKDNHIKQLVLFYAEKRLNCFDMFVILPKRVLELRFVAVMRLRPPRLLAAAKDPSCHVLCFDNKDTIPGHHNMIDLGRPAFDRKCQIFQNLAFVCIKR